jgi:hypothetical protein
MGHLLITLFVMLDAFVMAINGGEHQLHLKTNPYKNSLPHDIMTFHLVGLDVFIGGNF